MNTTERLVHLYDLSAKITAEIALIERSILAARRRANGAKCGTDSGYYRHRRHGAPTCAACKAAHAAATRDRATRRAA